MPVLGSYDVTALCVRATGLRFFRLCHCAELNKIVEVTMPVNPYDDRKVSLQRPHGNGDLDIVLWNEISTDTLRIQVFFFFYVGNLILLCKLCHYIMQIVI